MIGWRLHGARIDSVLEEAKRTAGELGATVTAARRDALTADVARGGPPAARVASAVEELLADCAADIETLRQRVLDCAAAVAAARARYDTAQAAMEARTTAASKPATSTFLDDLARELLRKHPSLGRHKHFTDLVFRAE